MSHARAGERSADAHPLSPRPAPGQQRSKVLAILLYSICSSSMLVVNKIVVHALPVPTLPFSVYTTAFAAGIYANIRALEATTVGAVIAGRSCLPLLVALCEFAFMGRQLPGARSSAALAGVLLAAGVYVRTDSTLSIGSTSGWFWLLVWFLLLAFQMLYGKFLASHHGPTSELGESDTVLWTNALALPPTLALCGAMGEARAAAQAARTATPSALAWLLLSCLFGVGISYTGWRLKGLVTATTFTLVGVVNKMASVALAAAAFPGATSPAGALALLACIGFGLSYRDPPMRADYHGGATGGGGGATGTGGHSAAAASGGGGPDVEAGGAGGEAGGGGGGGGGGPLQSPRGSPTGAMLLGVLRVRSAKARQSGSDRAAMSPHVVSSSAAGGGGQPPRGAAAGAPWGLPAAAGAGGGFGDGGGDGGGDGAGGGGGGEEAPPWAGDGGAAGGEPEPR